MESYFLGIAAVLILGISAQWLAWRFNFPSILLLLTLGFLAGPVFNIVDTDFLLGDQLRPFVSLSVAIILFEGGLYLRFSELRKSHAVIRNLLSLGVIVTWLLSAFFAWLFLEVDVMLAILIGAIFIVTGPTVVLPMLKFVRPKGQVNSILKWEGILNDPIGAIAAVLVLESILAGDPLSATFMVSWGIVTTLSVALLVGYLMSWFLVFILKRHLVPEFLQNPVTLALVIAAFAVSDYFQHESGLLAATLMGISLANQRQLNVKHIMKFKETLQILLISSLFILLAARLRWSDIEMLGWGSLWFLLALIFVIRPLAVVLSTWNSGLDWREKVFLGKMAPRGIVAAAVASITALLLMESGYPSAEQLIPISFSVIFGTILFYGLLAPPVARLLKLSRPSDSGLLIVGAHTWTLRLAELLMKLNRKVLLTDINRNNLYRALQSGLPCVFTSIFSDRLFNEEEEIAGIGRLLAATPNDEVNSLATFRFSEIFGPQNVFQVMPEATIQSPLRISPREIRGRIAFSNRISCYGISDRFTKGSEIKAFRVTKPVSLRMLHDRHEGKVLPMLLLPDNDDQAGEDLHVVTPGTPAVAEPGQIVVMMLDPSLLPPAFEELSEIQPEEETHEENNEQTILP